jgi:hypothetical protein
MRTDIATLRNADWDRVERETVERIRALRALSETLEPSPLNDRIAADLILPAMALLGRFAACVKVEEDGGK